MRNNPKSCGLPRGGRSLGVLLFVIAVPSLLPAATPAGTLIVNVAKVTHAGVPGPLSIPGVIQTNAVTTPVSSLPSLTVVKSAGVGSTVPPGGAIVYRMTVENPAAIDVTSVVITDALDPLLGQPVAITTGAVPRSDTGAPSGSTVTVLGVWDLLTRTVRWDVATVPAGARFDLRLTVPVDPSAPEDAIIRNATRQSSDQEPVGSMSNEAVVIVVSPALTLSKAATRDHAEVGDPIGYSLEIANISPSIGLTSVVITDQLPRGVRFLGGSARIDGAPLADPPPGQGPMSFDIGSLPAGERRRLTYAAVATPEAERSEVVNEAWGRGNTPNGGTVTAGPARATVRIARSLLSAEALLAGRVFVDDNRNGYFDPGEAGVPSARVYLEDGTFVLTDVVGKYHIEGVRAGLHVVKVDPSTLPDGLGALASGSRSAGGSGTSFADMEPDQMFKTNIATAGWGLAVSRLRAQALYAGREGEPNTLIDFPPLLSSAVFEEDSQDVRPTASTIVAGYASLIRERGGRLLELEVLATHHPLAATGLMEARAQRLRSEIARQILAAAPGRPGKQLPAAVAGAALVARGPRRNGGPTMASVSPALDGSLEPAAFDLARLEARVREMTPEPELLAPVEGSPLLFERDAVEFKLTSGLVPRLSVNGEEVSDSQIAVRMETSETHVVFFRYLGVPFREGRNALVVEGRDAGGDVKAWLEQMVDRIGPPASLAMTTDERGLTADGRSSPDLSIEVKDALGYRVADGTIVTLESDMGTFIGADVSQEEDGFQAVTNAGVASVHLSPATRLEKREITARAGSASGSLSVALGPHLRNWIVAGVGEASAGARGLGNDAGLAGALEDGTGADGRVAFFARGRVFGSAAASLMTVAYDSDRERDRDQVFRRLAPERYFPIYGDSSEQGNDVEGQGRFSLRLDQPHSSFAMGDFTTGLKGGDLLRYDRALTGGAGRAEMGPFTVQSFAATTPQAQARDELPGTGLSGPYRLSRRPVVVNSEQITLETRDRLQSERVITARVLARYADYDVDYESGAILFRQPVPFQDDAFNPVVAVVRYETLDGSGSEPVAGGRVGVKLGGAGEWGATYVSERRGAGSWTMRGTDFRLKRKFARSAFDIGAEAGMTTSALGESEGAYAFRASGALGKSVGVAASFRRVGDQFDNVSRAGLADAGTTRWGIEATATLPGKAALKGELYSQSDPLRGAERRVRSVEWRQEFARFATKAGAQDLSLTSPLTGLMASARLASASATMKLSNRLEATAGRQQIVSGAALPEFPTRTAVGMGWRMTDDIRSFVREEYDQTDLGTASRSVIGLEGRIGERTVAESRYSLEDALNGSRGVAQMGVRTRLPMGQDWMGSGGVERVATARGLGAGDFTALAMGAEYLPARSRFTTRYELRFSERENQHLLTTAGARRLTDGLSLFARQRLFLVSPEIGGSRFDGDGLMGLAFRPVEDDRLNFLFKLQGIKGSGAKTAGSATARTYLGIFETNYQPAGRLHLLGRLAVRESRDQLAGASLASRLWLAEARALVDITDRINAGLSVRRLDQMTTSTQTTGFGLESGFRAARDLWVVGGWNLAGIHTDGFGDSDRREAGPFVSVRFKFDEESLADLAHTLAPDHDLKKSKLRKR